MAHIERANAEALIPDEVSRTIIQETVKGSIALSLGMRMPDMIRKQLKMPVMTGTVSADFVNGDTGLKNTSQMTWDKVYITAEELAVIVPIPEAVLDDSDYDIFGEVRPRIVEAFSAAIDGAVFHGSGKPSTWPDGLVPSAIAAGKYVETTGNLYQDINGEQGVIAKVEESGISVNTYVGALQLRAKLRGAVDTAGQPIFRMAYTSGAAGAMVYELNGTPVAFPENGSLDGNRALLLAGYFK
jgi:HK97 family phage major capsid protein